MQSVCCLEFFYLNTVFCTNLQARELSDVFVFADVTAIIYVVACSSYNLVLREDPSQVRMFILMKYLIYFVINELFSLHVRQSKRRGVTLR